ncbi:sensor histidine kinase [Alcanivorax hongdengensis A-11-3]|uniref:histidine kinase n=1 Tax=Alcanivorax hongdengensis A-11-3 TaxID=1177179 RepID=L0WCI2_9GAMM|nr:sensor histidine kinase [Alcanivorax hongdengensis A-11-3]
MGWVYLCLLAMAGHSQALTLNDQQHTYVASPQVQWLSDPNYALSPAMALNALLAGQGQSLDMNYPSLGFLDGYQWFLLKLDNRSALPFWFLRAARPHLDYLDVYLFNPQRQQLEHMRLGDRIPFSERPLPHHQLVIPLQLPKQQGRYVLMRAQGENVIEMPVELMTPSALSQQDNELTLLNGLYFGSIAIMCLFNLLIFMSIRDVGYLFYVLYLGCFGLNLFTREGLSYQWLWPEATWWNHYSLPVLNLLTLAFSLLFSAQFLELKTRLPRLHRWLNRIAIGLFIAAPLSLVDFHFFIQASTAIVLPWAFIASGLALFLLYRGYTPARYFLLAFATIGLATVAYILKTFQVIEGNWFMENAMQLGVVAEALLLSFALANRMTVLKTENTRIQKEATDALEQRVAERTRELNAALSARSEFLAVMSHEIRTPLNGIIGTVDMLKASQLDHDQRHNLNVIEQSGNSLLNLINDILDYSRIEAGKMPIEETRFELPTLIHESTALFEHRAHVHSNTLTCELDEALGDRCVGDPVRLRQILVNLISNAVKFTDNGRITVRAQRDANNSDYVMFEVEDSGIGISQEQLGQLFDYFQQGDSSTSRRYGGTGLGLAICRQLVEIMGGEIGVDSETHRGSRFWFRLPLPLADNQPASPVASTASTPTVTPGNYRLLIVDDNHINLMVAEGLCKKLGYHTEVAESGMEAIAVLLSNPKETFDLILMDCEMPDMDGFETSRRIIKLQQEERLAWTPIIALTAHAVPDKIHACHDAGMVGHIAKPVNLARLQQALQQVLRGDAGMAS